MRRFILTGAPGAGKTVLLRQLECDGFDVVEEAATDAIALEQAGSVAEPWRDSGFPDRVAELQALRLQRSAGISADIQFHDRSAICTATLATYLGHKPSPSLLAEIERLKREAIYERDVFFVQLMGFIVPTEARRIGLEEAVRFEVFHDEAYRKHGFRLIPVPPGSVVDRVATIKRAL